MDRYGWIDELNLYSQFKQDKHIVKSRSTFLSLMTEKNGIQTRSQCQINLSYLFDVALLVLIKILEMSKIRNKYYGFSALYGM